DLAVVGGDRRRVDDHATLAIGIGCPFSYHRRDQTQHVETAQQVYPQGPLETGQRVLAVEAQHLLAGRDACAVDQAVQGVEILSCRCHGNAGLLLIRDVGDIGAGAFTQRARAFLQGRLVEIDQRHSGTGLDQHVSRRRAQAGRATSDPKSMIVQLHARSWLGPARRPLTFVMEPFWYGAANRSNGPLLQSGWRFWTPRAASAAAYSSPRIS